jgi:diguanylate cyclase (GGDEF)-like protein/PAS domain S-box-containing protein
MTWPEVAGIALAALAALLARIAVVQRKEIRRLEELSLQPGPGMAADEDAGQRALLRSLITTVREPVLLHRERIEAANGAFCGLVGLPQEEIVGRSLDQLVTADYARLVAAQLARRLAGEPVPELLEVELADSHGQVARLELKGATVQIGGQPFTLFSAIEMAPATKQADAAAPTVSRARAQLALEAVSEGVVVTGAQGHIEYLNPAAAALLGVSAEDAEGRQLAELAGFVDEHDRRPLPDPIRQCIAAGVPVGLGRRALLVAPSGTERHVELSASPIARRHRAARLRAPAVLPGDPRRADRARQPARVRAPAREALRTARRGDNTHILCYLDLDRFKLVNDTAATWPATRCCATSRLLREAVRDSDTVARLGGDEFGMLLIGCPLDKARQIADDLPCRRRVPLRLEGPHLQIGVSVGIVELARESGTLEDVLAAADSACYVAKKPGHRQRLVYSARDEALARHSGEIQWLQQLQSAIRGALRALPSRSCRWSRERRRATARRWRLLVRMRDETGRELPPLEFMRAAERYRLMGLVDRWVVQTGADAIVSGALPVPRAQHRAVNISGPDARRHAVPRVRRRLPRPHRRRAVAGVLRDHRDRGGREPRARAPLRRRAARHGLPLRARRLRLGRRLVLEPEEPADGLPEDRRLRSRATSARDTSTRPWSRR